MPPGTTWWRPGDGQAAMSIGPLSKCVEDGATTERWCVTLARMTSGVRDSRAGVGLTEAGQRDQANDPDQNVHCHQRQDCRGPCLWIQ